MCGVITQLRHRRSNRTQLLACRLLLSGGVVQQGQAHAEGGLFPRVLGQAEGFAEAGPCGLGISDQFLQPGELAVEASVARAAGNRLGETLPGGGQIATGLRSHGREFVAVGSATGGIL